MGKQIFELNASVRKDTGKGASRRLRRVNQLIPAIVYGTQKEPVLISLEQNKLKHALENEAFYSHILTLNIDGTTEQVVLKDLQRHPYKPIIHHIDFQRVSATQHLVRFVPVHFINEDIAPGVKSGGIVSHHLTEVEIRCLPKDLPEFIAFDLSNAQINDVYHLSDLILPEGVELVDISMGHEDNKALVSIHLPRGNVAEETPEEPTPAPEAEKADKKA